MSGMTTCPALFDYWRSSSSYRVRIALNMLGIPYESVAVDLLKRAHKALEHRARNPQGLIPALEIDGLTLTQSLAIIEYLDETRPDARFLPTDAAGRARVRALSYAIAMEIHPVCNMGVAAHVMELTGGGEAARRSWMQKFIGEGLAVFEAMLDHPATGTFCHGDNPTMADFCLVPQIYNAERWSVDVSGLKRARQIAEHCNALAGIAAAHPDRAASRPTA
jgi:maleylacetoacetate isomerase